MKNLQKMIAGLTLGMALCAGLLMASPAAAVNVNCVNTNGTVCCTFTCPNSVTVNGVVRPLLAVSCSCTSANTCAFACVY